MEIRVRPERVAYWLLGVIAVLTLLSLLVLQLRFGWGYERVFGLNLIGMFHLDADTSIPEWYSLSALLAAAGLAGLIAAVHRKRDLGWWRHWVGIALLLCYLSADESARLHEQSAAILEATISTERVFTRSWTVIAAAMVGLVGLVYLRFWWNCERALRWRLAASAAIFTGGAVGMEVVGHYIIRPAFPADTAGIWPYQTAVHIEEIMEKTAVVLVIYALLRYLEHLGGDLRLRIGAPAEERASVSSA